MIRAVVDTNVVLASQMSGGPQSPNVELVARWTAGEFVWLVTRDILEEYAEKLTALGVATPKARSLLANLAFAGEHVSIKFFHLRRYPADSDDTAFLLAALNGNASRLVTYDRHLFEVAVFYPEFVTCKPLVFLRELNSGPAP